MQGISPNKGDVNAVHSVLSQPSFDEKTSVWIHSQVLSNSLPGRNSPITSERTNFLLFGGNASSFSLSQQASNVEYSQHQQESQEQQDNTRPNYQEETDNEEVQRLLK